MINLAVVSTVLGLLVLAGGLPGLVGPERFGAQALAFPRSLWWGRILMGIAALIAGVVVFLTAQETALAERLQPMPASPIGALIHLVFLYGPLLTVVGVPTAYVLVVLYGQHYLALRGTAALLLLTARVVVEATDRSELPARLILTTLAYLGVVTALWMAIAPHHFRDLIGFAVADHRRCRWLCGAFLGLGSGLVLLGIFVY